jgi:uncharacterized membrane protein YGL010W
MGLLSSIPLPSFVPVNIAHVAAIAVMAFYYKLAPKLAFGMAAFIALGFYINAEISMAGFELWQVSLVAFVVAWIGQFIGHSSMFEGKKPSFFKDLVS